MGGTILPCNLADIMPYLRERPLRKVVVSYAKKFDGLSAANYEDLARFRQLLGPLPGNTRWDLERPFDASGPRVVGVSTCGLVAEGILRELGAPIEALTKPYVNGTSISRIIIAAQKRGIWKREGLPDIGDYVVLGPVDNPHAFTLIALGVERWLTLDGGQIEPTQGLQCIQIRSRPVQRSPLLVSRRSVVGWASVPGWWD